MTKQALLDTQAAYLERIQHGERELIPELWELLRPLTAHFLRRYTTDKGERLYDEADLWQESYLALVAALDYWQPERGAFATVYLWKIQDTARRLTGIEGSDAVFHATSLDRPVADDGEDVSPSTLEDMLEDAGAADDLMQAEHRTYTAEVKAVLEDIAQQQLTAEQWAVIRARYYDCLTIRETAEQLGITPESCRKTEKAAFKVYSQPRNTKRLWTYFADVSSMGAGVPFPMRLPTPHPRTRPHAHAHSYPHTAGIPLPH